MLRNAGNMGIHTTLNSNNQNSHVLCHLAMPRIAHKDVAMRCALTAENAWGCICSWEEPYSSPPYPLAGFWGRKGVVLCEYSKFQIKLNSYLLFNSIRKWRNYSKFLNTYLTMISRATEMRFVCTSCQKNHLSSATATHSHSRWLAGPVVQLGWSITYTGCRK